jgi:hypothetical protein
MLVLVMFLATSAANTEVRPADGPPVVYVAHDPASFFRPIPPESDTVGVEWTEDGAARMTTSPTSNYVCTFYDGCPANTRIINGSGSYSCNTGCTGNCTVCKGGPEAGDICARSPGNQCTTSLTLAMKCGKKGTGGCTSTPPTGPIDNDLCYCTVPTSWSNDDCKIFLCVPQP